MASPDRKISSRSKRTRKEKLGEALPGIEQEKGLTIFYGSAIQGTRDRSERVAVNRQLMDSIKDQGFTVLFDHTTGKTVEETRELIDKALGNVPPPGPERRRYVRKRMLEGVEGNIAAAIFEVSVPSLGTGIEIAHAYLRPRLGIGEIPILLLYQDGYWPNDLSAMVDGIPEDEFPNIKKRRYSSIEEAKTLTKEFLGTITNKS